MEQKTRVTAENDEQKILITREFDLPLKQLFRAYTEPELVEQWMENKVIKLESKKYGCYQFQKKDSQGKVVFGAHGVFHDFIENTKIIRTFEMDNAPFGVLLEFIDFETINEHKSALKIRTVFETVEQRDQLLKMPFAQGLNMAHNRLQEISQNLK